MSDPTASPNGKKTRDVVFRVQRYDPASGRGPRPQDYTVPVPAGMVVLEGLWYIKERLDPTLAWRASCRMGVCGSCGMLINGRPTLACNTQVRDVARDDLVLLAPLPNFAIVRDLVPDLGPMFDAHGRLHPYVLRRDEEEMDEPTGQFWQSPEQLVDYLQFSYCIKCGCCLAACPTVATDPLYSGPMPLAQGYRYLVDSRDDGLAKRREVLGGDAGPWRCHYAGECSRACPKGVDPARAIQLMKRQLVLDYLRLGKLRRRQPAAVLHGEPRPRREGIPEAPLYTIEPKPAS